jgi:Uncharacterized phage-associated protein
MLTIFDVAEHILLKQGATTAMKLQKLCYYAQAWSLAWDGKPLFDEDFQAWANGPVCPELFAAHRGKFTLTPGYFTPREMQELDNEQAETLDVVLAGYGHYEPYELSELTHSERPWRESRRGTPDGMPCDNVIEKDLMLDYYGGLISAE